VSVEGSSALDCVGPFVPGGTERAFEVGGHHFVESASTVAVTDADADDKAVFGVLANLKEATDENLLNLRKYVLFFEERKVEAVLVAGDVAERQGPIVRLLEPLAATGLPVLVVPGNHEARADFRAALDELAKAHPNVVDMTRVRLVRFDDASIVSLPGYHDPAFITLGEEGCQYHAEDVEALAPIVAAARGPAVLLAHAEPYGHGGMAIDAVADGNAGDARLTRFLRSGAIPFVVGANIHEAGGRATDLESNPVKEGEPAPRLLLNPGAADAVGWQQRDGSRVQGLAATLTIQAGRGTFHLFRAPPLTEAELAGARAADTTTTAP
jgi:Icc-related predicted phosphoesterase